MEKLKKMLTMSLAVITVLSMTMITGLSQAKASTSAQAGDLIKMDGLSSVYYLGNDGKRYIFPDEQTYFSWYSDFSGVVTISQEELESIPLGANVTIRPGTKLVKITTNPDVYAVTSGGKLVKIPDEDTAKALYGDDWAKRVVDVADSFFVNYTITGDEVSADAYPEGTLVKPAGSSDVYYINAEGKAQKIKDEAAFYANGFQWANVVTARPSYTLPPEGDEITGAVASLIDTSQGSMTSNNGNTSDNENTNSNVGSQVTVALSNTTPASATVPKGAALVTFSIYNFTASADGDVTIKNITLKKTGLGDTDQLGGVYLYDGNTRLTNSRTISSSNRTVTFSNVNFKVSAGTTRALSVRANIVGTTGNHSFTIEKASDITTDGASVSGSFPMTGNEMALSSVVAGGLTYTLNSVDKTTLKVGELQQEIADIKLEENSGKEDLLLKQISFTNDGTADPNDMVNFKLYQSTKLVATVASTDSDMVTFVLDTPVTITKSSYKNFSVKADIRGGVGTGSIKMNIEELTDIIATGASYGYNVGVTAGGSPSSITVEAGELTIEVNGPSSQDIGSDSDDVDLANLTFTTGGDEDVDIKNLYGYIESNYASTSNSMENIQLVNVDTGDVYDVSSDDTTNNTKYYFKVTDFTIPAGVSHWRIEMDTVESKVTNGVWFKFNMFAGPDQAGPSEASSKEGVEAKNQDNKALDDIKPNAMINGNKATVKVAALTVSTKSLNDGTAVANAKGVTLMGFDVKAGEAEDVKITEVALESASSTAAANYTLTKSDGTVLESGVSADSAGKVVFNEINDGSGFIVTKDVTETLYVKADISSSVTTGTMTVQMQNNGIKSEEVDDSDSVDATGDTTAIKGRKVTFASHGSLTLSQDNSSPDKPRIFLSGSTDNEALVVKADSDDENIQIDDMSFYITGLHSTTSVTKVTLYQKEGTGSYTSVGTGSLIDGGAATDTVEFNNINIIINKDTDSLLMVKVDIGGIGDGALDTAVSGAEVKVSLATTTAEGVDSGNDITKNPDSSVASKVNKVYATSLTVVDPGGQNKTLNNGKVEVLRFEITPSGNDGKTAQLAKVKVNIATSSHVRVAKAYIYSGSTLLASTTNILIGSGTYTTLDFATENGVDDISAEGETYVIKLDVSNAGADDKITATIDVNNQGNGESIYWKDYSGGSNINWVDLNNDTTEIDNTASY